MTNKDQHEGGIQMMNKAQEGHVKPKNDEREMSDKLKIKWQKRRWQLWLVQNFDMCFCSRPLANGRMRVTEHDIHPWPECHSIPKCEKLIDMIQGQIDGGEDFRRNFVIFVWRSQLHDTERVGKCETNGMIELGTIHNEITCVVSRSVESKTSRLCYLDQVVFKPRSLPRQLPTLRAWTNDEIKYRVQQEPITRFGRGYLEDMLDKMSITNEEEQVNEKEHHNQGAEEEGNAKDQTGISNVKELFWDGWTTTDLIITNSRQLAEVITESEEFILRIHRPLKRVRKVAAESVSDALIRDTPKRSKSRMPVLLQGSYESEGFLMQIDTSEKHFPWNVSREEIVAARRSCCVDSQRNSLAAVVQPLKYEKGGNEKRMMYHKAFIIRITICSFSSMVAQLNEAQTEAVDLKQILVKFSKWLVESFDPYFASFMLPGRQRFAHLMFMCLGVPIGGRKIMEITRSSTYKEYDEVHATWVKEWKLHHNAQELTRMLELILAKKDRGESFKRNFIIYLVSYFFSGPKNRNCNKSILKYVKDVNQIAFLDW
ncbi:LOW QUALITY PROTEIN: hypothetical protein Cgig2_018409 [Carnegiea gigantea]|uniref:Uncharacterized protein n=1 Tax=Carnegiea gigantea TaxID=171969 RepID=A0A9Q1GU66_9CARY|nr:LOW QUALITY PROTEIN: hypothetical protein Cgig2_018409 [Carnegiea gigantea]